MALKKFYIGTSGWSYPWNPAKTLEWYVLNSGLNAIELNYSFYKFPAKTSVSSWADSGKNLSWSIKVNRFITHVLRFNQKSRRPMSDFIDIFRELEPRINNYLFQLPPNMKEDKKDSIVELIEDVGLKRKAVIEPRDASWFNHDVFDYFKRNRLTFCSIDSPANRSIIKTTDKIYLRMHGRRRWYDYDYSQSEIDAVCGEIKKAKPRQSFAFFNNDRWMLKNAVLMKNLFRRQRVFGRSNANCS